jgi:hypothetical protein
LSAAHGKLLQLYPLSCEIYKLPEIDFEAVPNSGISVEGKSRIFLHASRQQMLLGKIHDFQSGIRADLQAAGEKGFIESLDRIEGVYKELSDVYGKLFQYLQTDDNQVKLKELYLAIPKGFADEDNLITMDINEIYFGLESEIRRNLLGLELKLITK